MPAYTPLLLEHQRLHAMDWQSIGYVKSPYHEDDMPPKNNNPVFPDAFAKTIAIGGEWAASRLEQDCIDRKKKTGVVFLMQRQQAKAGDKNTWKPHSMVQAWDGDDDFDGFGSSLALHGSTLAVGAKHDSYYSTEKIGDPGSVYVFEYDEQTQRWAGIIKISPPDIMLEPLREGASHPDDYLDQYQELFQYGFGYRVEFQGDILAVSTSPERSKKGSVYIYRRTKTPTSSWTYRYERKIEASDGVPRDKFGKFISLTDQYLVVGGDYGTVYVYDILDGWQETKIPNPATTPFQNLGLAVAAAGNTIVVGDGRSDNDRGAVYVYRKGNAGRSTWNLQATIRLPANSRESYFGLKVELSPNEYTILATTTFVHGPKENFLYRFDYSIDDDEWVPSQKIRPTYLVPATEFGRDFAWDDHQLIVSSYGRMTHPGAVHFFRLDSKQPYEMPNVVPGEHPEEPREEFRPWTNLLLSFLLLYLIQKLFLRVPIDERQA